ncbi:MAG: hypothetical protein FP826_07525 [Sphingomonadales bacterium]|nr:hypothetical protein [Sphingomonadales bacterium]MBU3991868.1 hypothetical protein [Alphaproteobacteria bacterium]
MMQLVEANWPVLVLAAVVVLLVAWWLFTRATKPAARRDRRPDVLDAGAAPAQRNQALIDAPPAASGASPAMPYTAPPAAELMGGIAEVIAAAVQEEAADAGSGEPASAKPADDLTRIKGVGPKLSALLTSLGVTTYAQIAAWDDGDLARIDAQLGNFAGRPVRDQWVAQAKLLAAGDTAGYEGTFGKL